MKRVLAGGAAFAAASFPVVSAEAAVGQPAECAPVYDEYQSNEVPSALQDAIDAYTKNQVAVHVELLDGATKGINNLSDVKAYQQSLATTCNYAGQNYVSIFVSGNPRLFNIHKEGKADSDITNDEVAAAQADFVRDLKDSSTPYEDDVTNLLNEMNPYVAHDLPAPQPVASGESQGSTDFPLGLLLKITGGLAIAGAVGARAKRGLSIKSRYKPSSIASATIMNNIRDVIANTEDALRTIPKDDAMELRAAETQIMENLTALDDDSRDVQSAYRNEVFRPWPSLKRVDAAADKLDKIAHKGEGLLAEAQQQLSDFERHSENANAMAAEFNHNVDSLLEAHDELTGKGWMLENYSHTVSEFKGIHNTVSNLIAQGYVDQPGDIIDAKSRELRALTQNIVALPNRRAVADGTIRGLASRVTLAQSVVSDTQSRLTSLRSTYDASCSADLAKVDAQNDKLLSKLLHAQAEAFKGLGILKVSDLEASEQILQDFAKAEAEVIGLRKSVMERQSLIDQIQTTLPERVSDIQNALDEVKTYAFEQYTDDVEEATRKKITAAIKSFKDLRDTEIDESKPKYLQINTSLDTLSTAAAQLYKQVTSEKAEMDTLRLQAQELHNDAEQKLRKLRSYVQSNSSDIHGVQTNFEIPQPSFNLSRADLKDQANNYEALIDQINAEREEAKRDVERAEASREAEREREREAAAAAALAAQLSSQSHHQQSDFGGNYGGGHDFGGGFGGGHDTGGTF